MYRVQSQDYLLLFTAGDLNRVKDLVTSWVLPQQNPSELWMLETQYTISGAPGHWHLTSEIFVTCVKIVIYLVLMLQVICHGS